jgi:perosamine synthetase
MIPVNEPLLNGNEKNYLAECIDTGWISSEGPFVHRLEKEFAGRTGRRHGVAVCNGSAALDLAVAALRLRRGDEVILPSFTIISCAACILRAGAVPVLVDSDPLTWNMRAEQVAEKVTARTSAIIVVHIYGLPVDMQPVLEIAQKHGLRIVEDASEMHGANYRGQPCGSFGELSTFSFYPNKHVTTGEGGMVLMNDDALAARCRSLRNLCFSPPRRFVHHELGWNMRMSNLQAAVGVAQLEKLDEFVERKRRNGRLYSRKLADVPGIRAQPERTEFAENIYWVYGVVLDDDVPFDAGEAMQRLAELGVETRPFFWPMHEQPALRKMNLFDGESYPVAERLARRGFYLPSGMALTENQIDIVVAAVRKILQ